MAKVVVVMEYVLDVERANSRFSIGDFTDKEFDQILAILRAKRKQPVPTINGVPNPSYSVQLMYDEGEEEEMEKMKDDIKNMRKKVSAADKFYKRFLNS